MKLQFHLSAQTTEQQKIKQQTERERVSDSSPNTLHIEFRSQYRAQYYLDFIASSFIHTRLQARTGCVIEANDYDLFSY